MADQTPVDLSLRIRQAAKAKGIDPDTLVNIARAESTLRPQAKSKTSSSRGLFGVIDSTWVQHGGDLARRGDIDEDIRVGAEVVSQNKKRFEKMFKRAPRPAELYAFHVFGAGAAPEVLRADKDKPMAEVVGQKTLKANPYWKNKTVGQVLSQFENKMGGSTALASNNTQKAAPLIDVKKIRGSIPAMAPLTSNEPAKDRFTPQTVEQLGPSYQAAMAAMALGDTSDDDEDEAVTQRLAEKADEAEAATPVAPRRSVFEDMGMSYSSPFDEVASAAPVGLADGGDPAMEKSDAREMLDRFANGGPVYRADGSSQFGEFAGMDMNQAPASTSKTPVADVFTKGNWSMPTRKDLEYLSRLPKEALSNLESVGRGSVAAVPGFVGDIEAMFRENKKSKTFKTTEDILKDIPRVTPPVTYQSAGQPVDVSSGYEQIGTFIDPFAMAKAVKPAIQIGKKGLTAAAPTAKAALQAVGPQIESAVGKIAPAAEPMYISRPVGGIFPTSGSAAKVPISELDEELKTTIDYLNVGAPERPAVRAEVEPIINFFDTKVRNYVRNQAGTVSDPVREGLLTGKIKIPKDSPLEEMFPQALIDAARKGDVTSMKLLEDAIDRSTKIRTMQIKPSSFNYTFEAEDALKEATTNTILKQMKENPSIIPDSMLLRLAKKNADELPVEKQTELIAEIRAKLKENPNLFNTVFEDKISRLIDKDLSKVVSPSAVETNPESYLALSNLGKSQEGIMALEKNAPIMDIRPEFSKFKILGMDMRTLAETAQQLPPKEVERMGVTEMINKALEFSHKSNQVENMATKAEKIIKQGEKVPENISTFGTKVFIPPDESGFVWREITDPQATIIQAKLMNNSIAGYAKPGTYGSLLKGLPALRDGEVRLFGLYDKNNQLMTNVEYITDKAENPVMQNTIKQMFGNGPRTGNVDPVSFPYQILSLIDKLNPDNIPGDISKMFRTLNIPIPRR